MLTTLEFENFGTIEKFTMTEGSEFKRFTVLGGMPDIIACFLQYVKKHLLKKHDIARTSHAIENSSHYTQFQDCVKAGISISQRHHQLITSTQSYEMLEAIVEALKDDKEAQDNFAYVRLDRVLSNQGHIEAVSYSYDLLSKAIKKKLEVR